MIASLARASARIRLPMLYLGFAALAVGAALSVAGVGPAWAWVFGIGTASAVIGTALQFLGPAVPGEPLVLASPVRGRWEAVNSPASRVPSHGTHGYGQSYAVDLVALTDEGATMAERVAPTSAFSPPETFASFGRPVLAPAEGIVVRATDRQRDHGSRARALGLAAFFAEAMLRELGGPSRVLGNHVVLRLDDGSHFVLAHLRHGSLRVAAGDVVSRGAHLADVGNTGNSTEPHLHCHRQDAAATVIAAGLPWTIEGDGIPENGGVLDAGAAPGADRG